MHKFSVYAPLNLITIPHNSLVLK